MASQNSRIDECGLLFEKGQAARRAPLEDGVEVEALLVCRLDCRLWQLAVLAEAYRLLVLASADPLRLGLGTWTGWSEHVVSDLELLRHLPYRLCVYDISDHNVPCAEMMCIDLTFEIVYALFSSIFLG